MNEIDIHEHFTVPEGYFETFTEHMMSVLPQQEFQPMKVAARRQSPWLTRVAASVASLVLAGLATLSLTSGHASQTAESSSTEPTLHEQQYTVGEAAEYAMLDRQDIYEMITE